MRSSRVLLGVLLFCAACGGKILDDPNATAGRLQPVETTSAPAPPAPSAPSAPSSPWKLADPCGTICERDGRCGAFQSDCHEHCHNQLRSDAACSDTASAYLHCYADNLEPQGCSVLPPVCEDASCAYARCAGKVVPRYCP